MKQKKEKKIVRKWSYDISFDTKSAEEYLSDMSSEGLFLKSYAKDGTSQFRKGEPKRLRYCIDLFDSDSNQTEEDYLAICNDAGWQLVSLDHPSYVYIFSSENQGIRTLHTDPVVKAECMKKTTLKEARNAVLGSFLLIAGNLFIFLSSYFRYEMNFFYVSDFITISILYILLIKLPNAILQTKQYFKYRKIHKLLSQDIDIDASKISPVTLSNSKKYRIRTLIISIAVISLVYNWYVLSVPASHTVPSYAAGITLNKLNVDSAPTIEFKKGPISLFYIQRSYTLNETQQTGGSHRIELQYYSCRFSLVAKDIYNRTDPWFSPVKVLTQEECRNLGVTEGKYISDEEFLDIVLRKDNVFYEIKFFDFTSFDENIKSVIRNAVAKENSN